MKLVFHDNNLGLRGTGIAIYDYASAWEESACGLAYIVADKWWGGRKPGLDDAATLALLHPGRARFEARFPGRVLLYDPTDWPTVNDDVLKWGVSAVYAIHGGISADVRFQLSACSRVPLLNHAVFTGNSRFPDKYAAVSPVVAGPDVRVVPHIVYIPPTNSTAPPRGLRGTLGIPLNATVVCRHGGWDSFDFEWVREGLCEELARNPNLWALFLNTAPLPCQGHPRLVHLPGTYDLPAKRAFLDSCDACVHATATGETFGLSIGECSLAGLPVITHSAPTSHRHHLDTLGTAAILYDSKETFVAAVHGLDPAREAGRAALYSGLYAKYSRENDLWEFVDAYGLEELSARAPGEGSGACKGRRLRGGKGEEKWAVLR